MEFRPSEAWRWWIDGLVDAVLLLEERLRRVRPVRLAPVAGGHAVVHAGGRLGRRVLAAGPEGLTPARLARRLKGRVVEVGIRPEEVVSRRLGPLPPESRSYVEGIVGHQLERMTPWIAADTLSRYRVDTVGPDDPRLMVSVAATSRSMHAGLTTALASAGPKEIRLVGPTDDGGAEVVLPIAAADVAAERGRIGLTVRIGLAALAVAAVLGLWGHLSAAADLDRQLAELEERLDGYQRRLAPARDAAASDRDLIAALSRETPMTVIALEQLSAALPDDTHLTGLQIGRGRLRMTGVTRDIAVLTTAVEATTGFGEPVLSAPTVRLAQGDRFTLDLKVAGAGGTKR